MIHKSKTSKFSLTVSIFFLFTYSDDVWKPRTARSADLTQMISSLNTGYFIRETRLCRFKVWSRSIIKVPGSATVISMGQKQRDEIKSIKPRIPEINRPWPSWSSAGVWSFRAIYKPAICVWSHRFRGEGDTNCPGKR